MKELFEYLLHLNLNGLFRTPTHNPYIQFFRYIFVGGLATVADWAVFYLLDKLNPHWMYLSTAVAFIVGLGVNYILSISFVFPHGSSHNKLTEFLVYLVTGIIGLGLTELLMFVFVDRMSLGHMTAKVIATAAVFAWNFGSKKILLYRKRHFK